MKQRAPFQPKALLWWVAIISLAVSGVLYFLLAEQARLDQAIQARRMLFVLIAVIIAGVCLIIGTAGRWFYPNQR
ncbi:MAG: hypothetical protein K9M45_03765 [Kiritimatiellales bacterium]|nr:hypothetical protein [Kiritimatiellales bacterium]